jgi:hypothetical protein
MNWIKGFDRIIFVSSIAVFFVAAILIYPETDYMPKLANPNPEYEVWYKEHGKKYEKYISEKYKPSRFLIFKDEKDKYPFDPPIRYLPIELHKRITATFAGSVICSFIWLLCFATTTRLINITIKWIIRGFKTKK